VYTVAGAQQHRTRLQQTMQNLHGTSAENPCPLPSHWERACSAWVDNILRSCRQFAYEDAVWEYLERTNSAFFSAALVACGVTSLPETLVMRNGENQQSKKTVDLCVVDNGRSIELVEFKLLEYDAINPLTTKMLDSKITAARDQANNITGIHCTELNRTNLSVRRVAGVIGLPCFYPNTSYVARNQSIQNIADFLQNSNYAVRAWAFPEKYSAKPSARYTPKYYPGTFVVLHNA
jgi:hypothetical protein